MDKGSKKPTLRKQVFVDLTASSPQTSGKSSLPISTEPIVILDYDDPDVMFVPPEEYSPAIKQRKINEEIQEKLSKADEKLLENEELKVMYFQPGLQLPHAREHCTVKKFKSGFIDDINTTATNTNKKTCDQCYCFVCEVVASECVSWAVGSMPHCNGFAKNATWEHIKRSKQIYSDFIFNHFSEEDKKFGVDPSCPDPTTWTKLLDMKAFFSNYNENKAVFIPCFCSCHTKRFVQMPCRFCMSHGTKCGKPSSPACTVTYADFSKSLRGYLGLCEQKQSDKNVDGVVAILLDGITSLLLLPGHKVEKDLLKNNSEIRSIFERLQAEWIYLFVNGGLSGKAKDKLKERLKSVISRSQLDLRLNLEVAAGVLSWEAVNTILANPSPSCFKQSKEEAELRFTFLRKQNRWQDIIKYGLSALIEKLGRKTDNYHFFSLQSVRRFLPILLAKLGKLVEAVIISDMIFSMDLPAKLMDSIAGKQPNLTLTDLILNRNCGGNCGKESFNYIWCPLADLSEMQLKNMLWLLRGENVDIMEKGKPGPKNYCCSSTPTPETLKLMLIVTIRSLILGRNLQNSCLMHWLVKALCTTNLAVSTKENGEKHFTRVNAKSVIGLINKAKYNTINADDLNLGIPLQALIVQVLVVLAVHKSTINGGGVVKLCWLTEVTKAFNAGNANEANLAMARVCKELYVMPPPDVVERMVETGLPIFGATILSPETYKSWFFSKKIPNQILVKLWTFLMLNTTPNSSASNHDREMQKCIRNDLGKYINKLIDNIVNNPLDNDKSALMDLELLCISSKEPDLDCVRDFHIARLELEFKVNPTCDTYKALKAEMSPSAWGRCLTRCCDYVRVNCQRIGVEKCLNVFYQLELFKEMKDFVTNLKMDDKSCKQVSQMFSDSCKSSHSKGVKVIDGFHPWLAQLLVSDFTENRCVEISEKTVDLLQKIVAFDPTVLDDVLSTAMTLFEESLNQVTCHGRTRSSALKWLINVKNMCLKWGKMAVFSRLYHKLVNGVLARKKLLVTELQKCNCAEIMPLKDVLLIDQNKATTVETNLKSTTVEYCKSYNSPKKSGKRKHK